MEISATEIDLLCRRISSSIQEYFLSSLYSMENGLMLRLHHATKPEILIAVSSFASWLTTKNLAMPQATPFVSRIRDLIERDRLVSVEQVGNERIARFSFQSRTGERHNLYAEFFARGNQILTELNEQQEEMIVDVANPQRFRHRSLIPGEKYSLPPSRGMPLSEVSSETLHASLRESRAEKIAAVRWFGRSVGTSRKFVEEIFFRGGIDPDTLVSDLTDSQVDTLAAACLNLRAELDSSISGFILLPKEEAAEEIGVDVCPIITNAWRNLESQSKAKVQSYPNLSDALDEAQVLSLILQRKRKTSAEIRAKAAELESAINKQEALIEKNQSASTELREIASEIMSGVRQEITTDLLERLQALELVEKNEQANNELQFVFEPRSFLRTFTVRAIASRLFDEAKRLEETNRKLAEIRSDLQSQKEVLEAQTLAQEERAERKISIERRPREWFERYRWFLTSDGRLAVGGRDSTSNSIVINKYTYPFDIVFHADLHGSPFFILKNDPTLKAKKEPEDEIALELAQATVSFSRAWKDELGSADAYWVYQDQVKKSAPSGEYLPRGSFFIEGKKNLVKHLKVELSVGLTTADILPHEKTELKEPKGKTDQIVVVCGPEKSLKKYCVARVRIAPGKEKGSAFAKRVKQLLVGMTKDLELKEMAKRIPIDEVIRSLPAGTYKLIAEKQNR